MPSAKLLLRSLARRRRSTASSVLFSLRRILRSHSTLYKGVCSTQRQRFLCCALAHSVLFRTLQKQTLSDSHTLCTSSPSLSSKQALKRALEQKARSECANDTLALLCIYNPNPLGSGWGFAGQFQASAWHTAAVVGSLEDVRELAEDEARPVAGRRASRGWSSSRSRTPRAPRSCSPSRTSARPRGRAPPAQPSATASTRRGQPGLHAADPGGLGHNRCAHTSAHGSARPRQAIHTAIPSHHEPPTRSL